jgi:hypothetical protein
MRQTRDEKAKTKCGMKRAMEILDKTEGAVRKGVERRQIPHRRMGRQIYFFEEELHELLDNAPGLRPEEILA